MEKLIRCINEIENLMNNPILDIEFAFNKNNELFIFQVRPITSQKAINNYGKYDKKMIQSEYESISNAFKLKKNLGGKSTVLGKMPDWNPAELIVRDLSHCLLVCSTD